MTSRSAAGGGTPNEPFEGPAGCAVFAYDAAAYAAGALDAAERDAFEQHLPHCAACAAAVAEATEIGALLRGLPRDALAAGLSLDGPDDDAGMSERFDAGVDDAGPVPDTLLPRLQRAAAARRRRTRLGAVAAVGLVAAAVAAVVVAVSRPAATPPTPRGGVPVAAAQVMQPLRPSAVHARAALVERPWGTEIEVWCRMDPHTTAARDEWYGLEVYGRDGVHESVGTWVVPSGAARMRFVSGTWLPRSDIQRLAVTEPNGSPVLVLQQ